MALFRWEGVTGSQGYQRADARFGGRLPGGLSPAEAQAYIGRRGDVNAGLVVAGLAVAAFLLLGRR